MEICAFFFEVGLCPLALTSVQLSGSLKRPPMKTVASSVVAHYSAVGTCAHLALRLCQLNLALTPTPADSSAKT
eukprot:2469724-Amphidinium_carterae.1